PHTWWHWMDGNVTKEGITADLEAMKQVGIGGAQMFTVSQNIPKGPVDYMSPKWRELTTWAVKEAGRLGLELCIHNCAGWSSSGGPWVKPEDAMQVLAWSEVRVTGPKHFDEDLPPIKAPQVYANVDYSEDIATYAFQAPPALDLKGGSRGAVLGATGVVRNDSDSFDYPEIDAGSVQPLTLGKNGHLTWDVPEGNWTILRIGHVPTGKDNHPAPKEGDGLEVDKLSRTALDHYWNDGTMAAVLKDTAGIPNRALNNALIDSYEVGTQNWTPNMRAEFVNRRGYDPMHYLPVFAGYTVESKDKTQRFLWDWRRTIADLYADNYYGYFAELCHQNGLLFSTEPYGNGGFDDIEAGGKADIPMGEFWISGGPNTVSTTKIASSAGHTNGHKIIGAESFTADVAHGGWKEEPYALKAEGDLVFCNGVNRYIFHRYAMQPWLDQFPGMTMGPWGTHLERTQTWWTEAQAWMKYIARCQYLLQQGRFVADALYCYGENAPNTLPGRESLRPRLVEGSDYDGCDATVVYKLSVQNGMLVLPDGMTYRGLVLTDSKKMTPEFARKIRDLVSKGAHVWAEKPTGSPSLTAYGRADKEVLDIADDVWGYGSAESGQHTYGQGSIAWGDADKAVVGFASEPDFQYQSRSGGSRLAYIHRTIDGVDVYFVSNQRYSPTYVSCTFRVNGKIPEIWHPDTGAIEEAPAWNSGKSGTSLDLHLDPAGSVFIVFRKNGAPDGLRSFSTSLEPVPTKTKITIVSARYGASDGRGADVTDIVRKMVEQGTYEITADNGTFGDPVVNVVKQLTVSYTVDGKSMTKTVPENDTLELIEVPKVPNEIAPYVLKRRGTNTFMAAFKPFTYGTVSAQSADDLDIKGPWQLDFPMFWGAPSTATFPELASWTESDDVGIKYFSGSAVYTKTFDVPADMLQGDRLVVLDLGRVKNFATVTLNGKDLGILWKEPFAVDVTGVVKPGANELKIKVTNLWVNRIIGDERLPSDVEWEGTHLKKWPEWLLKGEPRPSGRYTFETWKFYDKDSPLLESGLLGPVVLRSAKWVEIRQ
ncbi:MAG TPA: glycosyl hydrolase, partial [Fimbriimonadaceae bacterium]|nr:glycosyl hydrolase [Fimbriimonadaceae bacterium]